MLRKVLDSRRMQFHSLLVTLVVSLVILPLVILFKIDSVAAFCGFYVGKADTKLFNQASKVVLVRDGERTVLTMANDFRGAMTEFAIVIPVPTFIEEQQIHVGDNAVIDHLDAYSAPRLVEYFDPDPCSPQVLYDLEIAPAGAAMDGQKRRARADGLGVKIEAEYTVGEYDIVILSAEQSTGLETWLKENGYRIPDGAADVLGSYIKQKVRFFVAKVNLTEQAKLGFSYLRPLQIAFESPKFMLPIRLGMVNADGDQELFVFALTRKGRIETTNYRTVRLPTGMDIPEYVKGEFGEFYRAMFSEQVRREDRRAVFLEYAWDMGSCDPCAADPLTSAEQKSLGVFWLDDPNTPSAPQQRMRVPSSGVFITRLHLRYNATTFPEDLNFQETADRSNFQGRYVLRHPWKGAGSCAEMTSYRKSLTTRRDQEAQNLATLTGWEIEKIRGKMGPGPEPESPGPTPGIGNKDRWWEKIW